MVGCCLVVVAYCLLWFDGVWLLLVVCSVLSACRVLVYWLLSSVGCWLLLVVG